MPSLKIFSLFESEINYSNFNNLPFSSSFDDTLIEIDYENQNYIISSNIELMVNFRKCYFSEIKTNDLISFNNEFIIFSEENSYTANSSFIGKIRQNDDKILIFKLPRKISKRVYADIHKIMSANDEKKIYIEAGSTQYMDSEAINSMLELIYKTQDEKRSLFFYNPGEKFNSYLKLANITKKVPVKISKDTTVSDFIENRQNSGYQQAQNRYMITDNINNYIVGPEKVISVGRMNNTCDIVLSDERISRIHALIVNTNNSLYVIDCLSTNFTYINGWKITPYCLNQLKVNDILVFGQNVHFKIKQI